METAMEKDEKLDIEQSCELQQIINELTVILKENTDGYIPEPPC